MERKVVTFVNDTEEVITFKVSFKFSTGNEFTLGDKSGVVSNRSAQHSEIFLGQTQTRYGLYDSTDVHTGLWISSDDLLWKNNTVTVAKDGDGKFTLTTTDSQSSLRPSSWKGYFSKLRTLAAQHLQVGATSSARMNCGTASNPETPEENA